MERITHYYQAQGIDLGRVELARSVATKAELAGAIALCPPGCLKEPWSRRFPDPITCMASGWMRVRARARQHLVELPLVISDHVDWDGLTSTVAAVAAPDVWVTHGQEDALVHWSKLQGLRARPLDIVGYGDEEETDPVGAETSAPS
jgi:putative mRNA 3-end processing factor